MACNERLSLTCIACVVMGLHWVMASSLPQTSLIVSCPDTALTTNYHDQVNFTISVSWMRPDSIDSLFSTWFERVCLKGNVTDTEKVEGETDFEQYNEAISAVVGPGTVCLFKGRYTIIDPIIDMGDISLESCEVPALQSTGKVQLRLNCSDSVAAVEVITPNGDATLNSTDVRGKCITPNWRNRMLMKHIRHLEPGNTSICDLPNNTICSFYGSYQLQTSEVVDFEPVQCIMNRPSDPPVIPLPPTTTEDTTTTTTTTGSAAPGESITSTSATSGESTTSTSATSGESTTSTSATSGESTTSTSATSGESTTSTSATSGESTTSTSATEKKSTAASSSTPEEIVIVITSVVVMAIVVTLLMTAACFAWRSYHGTMRKKQKNQLHIWDHFITKENLDQDPPVLPQFPYASHAPDSLSITTEVDYLYKEEGRAVLSQSSLSSLMKSMQNDEKAIESPKLIMDRLCHQRVWESSHESLSNVPPFSTQEQGNSRLTKQCAENVATYDGTNPVPSSDSHLVADSDSLMAQHYKINTKLDDIITTCCVNDSGVREFTPSSIPTEHYFTDDEGYLRLTKETTV